jgi:hypothetical protein
VSFSAHPVFEPQWEQLRSKLLLWKNTSENQQGALSGLGPYCMEPAYVPAESRWSEFTCDPRWPYYGCGGWQLGCCGAVALETLLRQGRYRLEMEAPRGPHSHTAGGS